MTPFRSIAAWTGIGVETFALGIVGEVFGNRTHRGQPAFDLAPRGVDAVGRARADSSELDAGWLRRANAATRQGQAGVITPVAILRTGWQPLMPLLHPSALR